MMEHLPIEPVNDTGSFIFAEENILLNQYDILFTNQMAVSPLKYSTKTQFCLELFAVCARIKKKGILVSNRHGV